MQQRYNYAFFDEASKREIRRAIIKGVSIPGYQVPFASREMPIGRGWGTGGLQITLAIIGPDDTLKVIDQGSDDSVNAVNIKKLVVDTTDVEVTDATEEATLIQSRHRIPERPLRDGQILVLQVPTPEPLRSFEPSESATKRLHAEADYTGAWLELFDQIVRYDTTTTGADHPVLVNGRYVMAPSPIPRFDNLKLHQADHLTLLGAGREKKIYAVPPHTNVVPLDFEDYPFVVESFANKRCRLCGAEGVYLDELVDEATGETYYQCNDTAWCAASTQPHGPADSLADPQPPRLAQGECSQSPLHGPADSLADPQPPRLAQGGCSQSPQGGVVGPSDSHPSSQKGPSHA
ncbi:alpha-D-ribose 1-methylphosphonate 5-phosphate C-P-lyase PhnJ [Eggerthella sinensis]|uniref:alpha-D-ribose 1-methylphosphonate 5-phosphate C-P-lyase PhnJ n=2 Tax=Eggerthella TaxID=84111 RepID=UPI00266CDBC1|nr:alpha-D-ribose 1-methylphosphonate 5-phosphate C-P-lyase PhnJ [Eggerthella sinensis]